VSEYFYNFYLPHYPVSFFFLMFRSLKCLLKKTFVTHFLQQILIIVYDYNLLTMVLIMSVALSLLSWRLWRGQIDAACCGGGAVAALADDLCRQLALVAAAAAAASAVQW
jgi:hypothetical protein